MSWAVAIHGGAGLIRRASLTSEREAACTRSLEQIVRGAAAILDAGGTALDAAIAAVVELEDDPLFNAGRGAVLTSAGTAELDASVMDGRDRRAGGVTFVRTVRHPILLARAVMDCTPHVLLVGGEDLADEVGLERVDPSWFVVPERVEQLERARAANRFHLDHGGGDKDVYGTVGAVCCDRRGHVAAATSTGGMVNKRPGRVGDTPIVGAGTFAWDATCAVSGTGHGEAFMRSLAAARVSARMELGGQSLEEAARRTVDEDLAAVGGQGGLIAVDAAGRVAMPFNTGGMFRAALQEGSDPIVAIW